MAGKKKVTAPAEEVKETVAAPAAEEKKAPVKKAAAKKTAEKKAAAPAAEEKKTTAKKTAAKKAEAAVYIQYLGAELTTDDLVAKAKADAEIAAPKSVKIYVKPEENKVYYVIDDKEGSFFLV